MQSHVRTSPPAAAGPSLGELLTGESPDLWQTGVKLPRGFAFLGGLSQLTSFARIRLSCRKMYRLPPTQTVLCQAPPVNAPTPATAIIDGALCHLTRRGTPSAVHAPLATAIVEFLPGAMCYFVREHPLGLLPGIANLYCLDADLHLLWMAEWPSSDDPCVAIDGEENGVLFALSASGALVRLDSATGRLLGVDAAHDVAV